jgi:hypothetical protein
MPSEQELERRFNDVLIQMDLPPERAKILKGFTNEKKWDTVCDHDLVHAKERGCVAVIVGRGDPLDGSGGLIDFLQVPNQC